MTGEGENVCSITEKERKAGYFGAFYFSVRLC